MKLTNLVISAIASLLMAFIGIWIYDKYKANQVEGERTHTALFAASQNKKQVLQSELLSYGFQLAGSIKATISEAYAANGTIPESNLAAGLQDASIFHDDFISSMEIGPSGSFTISFVNFPDYPKAHLKFVSKVSKATDIITWRCTSDVEVIKTLAPACQFLPTAN